MTLLLNVFINNCFFIISASLALEVRGRVYAVNFVNVKRPNICVKQKGFGNLIYTLDPKLLKTTHNQVLCHVLL